MKRRALLPVLLLLVSGQLYAQQHVHVPQTSPAAQVGETFGVTDVSVDYHRPTVNNRRIFGGLVPYDVLWRAGANENTLITVSTPVTVEGQPLPAGTYSLFYVPGAAQWTAVFNRFTGGWGTYSYDPAEDVLRVNVTPQTAEPQERMAYTFEDGKADSIILSMRWEKTRVPLKIAADTKQLTMSGLRNRLRSGVHWDGQAWNEAARYAFRAGDLDAALSWVNHSIDLGPDMSNLRLKAAIVEKNGDPKSAKELRDRAATLNPDAAALSGAFQLLGAKKYDEAEAALNGMIAKGTTPWRAYSVLGVLYAQKGDAAKSTAAFQKAMSLAPTFSDKTEVQDDLNALGAEVK
jgi:tetratricopeptide (TPR) repeat protein